MFCGSILRSPIAGASEVRALVSGAFRSVVILGGPKRIKLQEGGKLTLDASQYVFQTAFQIVLFAAVAACAVELLQYSVKCFVLGGLEPAVLKGPEFIFAVQNQAIAGHSGRITQFVRNPRFSGQRAIQDLKVNFIALSVQNFQALQGHIDRGSRGAGPAVGQILQHADYLSDLRLVIALNRLPHRVHIVLQKLAIVFQNCLPLFVLFDHDAIF